MAWSDVSDDDKLRCAMLWELVWPSGDAADTTARLEKMAAGSTEWRDDATIDLRADGW